MRYNTTGTRKFGGFSFGEGWGYISLICRMFREVLVSRLTDARNNTSKQPAIFAGLRIHGYKKTTHRMKISPREKKQLCSKMPWLRAVHVVVVLGSCDYKNDNEICPAITYSKRYHFHCLVLKYNPDKILDTEGVWTPESEARRAPPAISQLLSHVSLSYWPRTSLHPTYFST